MFKDPAALLCIKSAQVRIHVVNETANLSLSFTCLLTGILMSEQAFDVENKLNSKILNSNLSLSFTCFLTGILVSEQALGVEHKLNSKDSLCCVSYYSAKG